ncbi:enoyl-CoA hydratase/isomerase family protein [Nocardia rhamnosiphila]
MNRFSVTKTGPIRTLTLNRPHRRNALKPELIEALDAALTDAEADSETRCLIVTGAGKTFCAGGDLQYFLSTADLPGGPTRFLRRASAVVTRLETSRLPVVAALHGHVVAGGLELALACDVVVAADNTLIGDGHIRNTCFRPRARACGCTQSRRFHGPLAGPDRTAGPGPASDHDGMAARRSARRFGCTRRTGRRYGVGRGMRARTTTRR